MNYYAGLSVRNIVPLAGFPVLWSQPDVTTTDLSSSSQKVAQWSDIFGRNNSGSEQPDTSKSLFQSQPESIFQVPEHTDYFLLKAPGSTKYIYITGPQPGNDEASLDIGVHVFPPVLKVTPRVLYVLPKEEREIFVVATINGLPGLGWRLQIPPLDRDWLSVTPTFGSGSQIVTIKAKNTAKPGDFANLQFDTDPPRGASSVENAPLVVLVDVVADRATRTEVLLAGGSDWSGRVLNTAEIWDPETEKTFRVGNMTSARKEHTATALPDGKVLIAGGRDNSGVALKTAELYDPETRTFTRTGDMNEARRGATATLLNDDRVLIAGGCCDANGDSLKTAEIYNEVTGKFTMTAGSMNFPHFDGVATLLPDGLVLIAGGVSRPGSAGILNAAELFDSSPASRKFFRTGNMIAPRQAATAVPLGNGQVLVAGGFNLSQDPLPSAELYTPASGAFTSTRSMDVGRRYAASVLLLDGRALVLGGYNGAFYGNAYNPETDTWGPDVYMSEHRDRPTATLLTNTGTKLDGDVLVAGGVIPSSESSGGKPLEMFDPKTNRFVAAGNMTTPRTSLTATAFTFTEPAASAQPGAE